jgi:hypothetical protein
LFLLVFCFKDSNLIIHIFEKDSIIKGEKKSMERGRGDVQCKIINNQLSIVNDQLSMKKRGRGVGWDVQCEIINDQ